MGFVGFIGFRVEGLGYKVSEVFGLAARFVPVSWVWSCGIKMMSLA